jgi:hypothetical protein
MQCTLLHTQTQRQPRVLVLLVALGRERGPHLGPDRPPTPEWSRPGATPEETLGRHGDHH